MHPLPVMDADLTALPDDIAALKAALAIERARVLRGKLSPNATPGPPKAGGGARQGFRETWR